MCPTRGTHRSISKYHDESDHKEKRAFVRSKRKSVRNSEVPPSHSTNASASASASAPTSSRTDQIRKVVLPPEAIPSSMYYRPRSYSRRRPLKPDDAGGDNKHTKTGPDQQQPQGSSRREAVAHSSNSANDTKSDRPPMLVRERQRSHSRQRSTRSRRTGEKGDDGGSRIHHSPRPHQRVVQEKERDRTLRTQTQKVNGTATTSDTPKRPDPHTDRSNRQVPSQPMDLVSTKDLVRHGPQHAARTPVLVPPDLSKSRHPGISQNEADSWQGASTRSPKYQSRAEMLSRELQQPTDPTLRSHKGNERARGQDYNLNSDTTVQDTIHGINTDLRIMRLAEQPRWKEREHEHTYLPDQPTYPNISSRTYIPSNQIAQIRTALLQDITQPNRERENFERSSRHADGGRRMQRVARPQPDARQMGSARDIARCERPRIVAFASPPRSSLVGRYRAWSRAGDSDESSGDDESFDDDLERGRGRSRRASEAKAY